MSLVPRISCQGCKLGSRGLSWGRSKGPGRNDNYCGRNWNNGEPGSTANLALLCLFRCRMVRERKGWDIRTFRHRDDDIVILSVRLVVSTKFRSQPGSFPPNT